MNEKILKQNPREIPEHSARHLQNQLDYFGCKTDDLLLRASNALEMAKILFNHSMEGVILTDHSTRIQRINQTFTEVTGYKQDDVIGKTPAVLQSGQHGKDFYKDMWESLKKKGKWQRQIFNCKKNGELYPEWLTIYAIKNENGTLINYLGMFTDLTNKALTKDTIHHLAYYDPLTNLPNRLLFSERLKQNILIAKRKKSSFALFFIDLDGFKKINDSLGHDAGDILLQEVALRLRRPLRESDTVSRLGGDEFTIILDGYDQSSGLITVLDKILKKLSTKYLLGDREVYVSASIGISIYPYDGQDMVELIKNADTSMYVAKEKGKNRYEFYDSKMNLKMIERLNLESDLHTAYDENQFMVYYQPKINLQNNMVEGAEALIRWKHPSLGFIPPSQFIPLAEEIGMITPLGEWIFRQVCHDVSTWQKRCTCNIKISVNLSSQQFRDPNLVSMIKAIVHEEGVYPRSLEFEITESMLMHDVQSNINVMNQLKEMGFSLSIDDFGTGYSSLKYLKQFPIDVLKIDKSFIDDIPDDPNDMMLTKSIIDLAHNLAMEVIAEGVEKDEQIEFLLQNGCKKAQGFYFSKAIEADAFYDYAFTFRS